MGRWGRVRERHRHVTRREGAFIPRRSFTGWGGTVTVNARGAFTITHRETSRDYPAGAKGGEGERVWARAVVLSGDRSKRCLGGASAVAVCFLSILFAMGVCGAGGRETGRTLAGANRTHRSDRSPSCIFIVLSVVG